MSFETSRRPSEVTPGLPSATYYGHTGDYGVLSDGRGASAEITAPAREDLPAEQYYDHTGLPPASADIAEICTTGDEPERTPPTVWKGPWKFENFPGGPRRRDQKPVRDWRQPLPPPEPPRVIPALERMTTPKQNSAARQRRIGARLLEWQRRLGLID